MKKINKLYYLFLFVPFLLVIFLLNLTKPLTINKSLNEENKIIRVSIFGEVLKPGTYYLTEGSTYMDLIERCGITDKTFIDSDLLDVVLKDGQTYEVSIKENNLKHEITINDSNIDVEDNNSDLININIARIEILVTLPSIGTVRANAIIDYRNIHKFIIKEDLLKVKGITKNIYDKVKDYITV